MVKGVGSGEILVSSIRSGMKREFAMMMKAQLEMGDLSSGRRRVTRSQNVGASGQGNGGTSVNRGRKVNGVGSKRAKKGEDEKPDVEKMVIDDVLDAQEEQNLGVEQNGLVEEGTNVEVEIEQAEAVTEEQNGLLEERINVEVELRDSPAEPVAKEKIEVEGAGDDLKESVVQSLSAESALPQVGLTSDVETLQAEDRVIGEASALASEKVEEVTNGLPEKPLRRFTRSALKLKDQAVKLESGAGVAQSPAKLELKMSKKVEPKKDLTKLEDLLQTGLLESLNVRNVSGPESKERAITDIHGVIQGNGILCSCGECTGVKIVTPDQFVLHAQSRAGNPAEYIYLENGKNLQDVLNECKVDHSDSLEKVIRHAIGRSGSSTTAFCLSCKGPISEAGSGRAMLRCDSCLVPKESDLSSTQISDTAPRSPLADLPVPVASTSQSDAPESAPVSSNSQPRTKPQGRLTKKDLGMHKIVFTEDVLPDGAALNYVVQGQIKLAGAKKDGAILCSCCGNVVSPSQFEAHAGFASRRKPYDNIFTSNGMSLHKLSLELSRNRISSPKESDDLCSICEDGGDLLCCEHCPRAFHPECVGLSSIPQDTWYCRYCQNMFDKAKYEERSANAIAAGRKAGVDPLAEITQRCIRIFRTSKSDIGGCAICRSHDFTKKVFNDRTVIICDQCEKEYHVGCLREQKMDDLKALPKDDWFCCKQCNNISSTLQKVIVDGQQRVPEALTDIVKKKGEGPSLEEDSKLDITWRLLRGNGASSETPRKWLSGVVSVFHDRFDPIADSSTSHLDLIPHMVYGRKFRGQDFRGMYCAVLMVNSVEVCAGMFRIFGEEVAELPLVATRSKFEGKGYFQSLFFCIENLLQSLNVKDLVLPAANEAESLWTNRFGFEKLGREQIDHYKKNYSQMMIFQETSVLHKLIMRSDGGKASDELASSAQAELLYVSGGKASDEVAPSAHEEPLSVDGGKASDEGASSAQEEPLSVDGGKASDEVTPLAQEEPLSVDGGKASGELAFSAHEEPPSID